MQTSHCIAVPRGMSAPEVTSSVLAQSIVRNLGDKLYEKRKAAALEVEQIIKDLVEAKDSERIASIITTLTSLVYSNQGNSKKGGLIALAATAIGLAEVRVLHACAGGCLAPSQPFCAPAGPHAPGAHTLTN